MAFLDNSGDIILDAVLTDAGRKRLAEGDGSFRITKYAFGDDEIDYNNYNASNTSGSAYYDLEILQTPVLEAFTNNTANMKSKLITLTNNNILYLPVIRLNQLDNQVKMNSLIGSGSVVVTCDQNTTAKFKGNGTGVSGPLGFYIAGDNPGGADRCNDIRVDQGLDTADISAAYKIDAELQENQYIVEIDNRFATVVTPGGKALGADGVTPGQPTSFSFIDDDNIASYYLSTGDFVRQTPIKPVNDTDELKLDKEINKAVAGPRGTHLSFRLRASTNLRTSTYLFERLGSTFTDGGAASSGQYGTKSTYYYIDTIVRVTGATTGFKIDIPVRFVKYKSANA
jgi:hypothetical protein